MQAQFVINKQVRLGNIFEIRVQDLTARERARIHPPRNPSSAEGWAGRALMRMAKGDLEGAKSDLSEVKAGPLAAPLARRLEKELRARLEAEAKKTWAAFRERAAADVNDEQARALLKELAAWERDYAGTDASAALSKEREGVRERLRMIALAFEKRVAKLFKGRILAAEPRTGTVTVHYDFEDREQIKDFRFGRPDKINEKILSGGRLVFQYSGIGDLYTERFSCEDIEVSYRFAYRKAGGSIERRPMQVLFGSENACHFSQWPGACSLWQKRPGGKKGAGIARGKLESYEKGKLVIQKKGKRFTVLEGGKKVLEGSAHENPGGDYLGLGGIGHRFHLDDLTIRARLAEELLKRLREPPAER
jgi:hypothetical protein